jgi:hypothetical protein
MDFKLFRGVVKRYKRMVILGTLLAVAMSVFSYGTPGLKGGKPTIIPRGSEVWQGNAVVLISQAGNPYDRAVQQVIPGKGLTVPPETIGDLTYMSSLSSVYAAMANGDSVQNQVATAAHVLLCPVTTSATAPAAANATGDCGTLVAAALEQQGTGSPLPLITLTSSAPTASEAARLSTTAIAVLRSEITKQQAAAGTPVQERVELQTVNSGSPATLAQGHSKSISILVLFALMGATFALAFIRNNHSENPVRSTRRRLDEGLDQNGGLAVAGAGNGLIPASDDGLARTGGGRMQLIGLRRTSSGSLPADDENGAMQRAAAEESSATDGRRAWSDRRTPHLLRRSGVESESRD